MTWKTVASYVGLDGLESCVILCRCGVIISQYRSDVVQILYRSRCMLPGQQSTTNSILEIFSLYTDAPWASSTPRSNNMKKYQIVISLPTYIQKRHIQRGINAPVTRSSSLRVRSSAELFSTSQLSYHHDRTKHTSTCGPSGIYQRPGPP